MSDPRPQLVIVDNYLSEAAPCALCGTTILPLLGPEVYLAENLHGTRAGDRVTADTPAGIVCGRCTEKHEPAFRRLLQLGHQAGLYYTDPYLAVVDGQRATVRPVGGRWQSLWWWKGGAAPDLELVEDEYVYEAPGQGLLFAPRRWGWKRIERFMRSGEVPDAAAGWSCRGSVMPTL